MQVVFLLFKFYCNVSTSSTPRLRRLGKTAGVAYARGSLVSFAGLLSAFKCTAVQIHAKLIIELKIIYQKWSLSVQVGRGGNALCLCGIALVPACWGHWELFCKFSQDTFLKSEFDYNLFFFCFVFLCAPIPNKLLNVGHLRVEEISCLEHLVIYLRKYLLYAM